MPRPPVLPENRRRVAEACTPCKAAKRRCDSRHPCSACQQRGLMSQCRYTSTTRRRPRNSATPQRQIDPIQVGVSQEASLSEVTVLTSDQILHSPHGQSVFLGDCAPLSFLQLLRQAFGQHFIHQEDTSSDGSPSTHRLMLEEDLGGPDLPLSASIDVEDLGELVDAFFVATCRVIEVDTRSGVHESLRLATRKERFEIRELPIDLKLILAIGAQCRLRNTQDRQISQALWVDAKPVVLGTILQPASVDTVVLNLLTSFYMLARYRRNSACLFIGVAAQLAHTLGLHRITDEELSSVTSHKARVWKSIHILDTIICSILGRPLVTAHVSVQDQLAQATDLDQSFRLSTIVRKMLAGICSKKRLSVADAEEVLVLLTRWREDFVAQSKESCGAPLTNISCLYYHAVLVTTRPFLVFSLKGTEGPACSENERLHLGHQTSVANLASACLDSAIYIIQACHDAVEMGFGLENPCFIKAWTFSAGLTLAFRIFAPNNTLAGIEDAYQQALAILERLSPQSPHAQQYSRILRDVHVAVQNRRERQIFQRRQSTRILVDRICVGEATPGPDPPSAATAEWLVGGAAAAAANSFAEEELLSMDLLGGFSFPFESEYDLDMLSLSGLSAAQSVRDS